jgi:signal peptidase I
MKAWQTLSPGRRKLWVLLGCALALAGALFVTSNLLFVVLPALNIGRVIVVPNRGMAPVIRRHDSVYLNELAFRTTKPKRGDIVGFRGEGLPTLVHTGDWQVKRVVGVPGDIVSIRDGTLYIGDQPAPELARFQYVEMEFDIYLSPYAPSYTVPPDSYFVLGDFPDGSYDSRFYGAVPMANIKGRPVFRIWPPGRLGVVR